MAFRHKEGIAGLERKHGVEDFKSRGRHATCHLVVDASLGDISILFGGRTDEREVDRCCDFRLLAR